MKIICLRWDIGSFNRLSDKGIGFPLHYSSGWPLIAACYWPCVMTTILKNIREVGIGTQPLGDDAFSAVISFRILERGLSGFQFRQ